MKHSHSHSPILKKFLIAFAVLGTLIAFAVMLLMTTQQSTAQVQTGDLSGYAYSNVEGVGWISMSCENDGSCGTVNYGVNIDNSGNWSGRGWSPNVGWINFGGSAEVPTQCGPRPSTNPSTGATTGWAYLASSSGASLQDSGAITGCISMSGTALDGTPYGVEVDYATDTLGGYAWSGYDVQTDTTGDGSNDWQSNGIANVGLGWINFSNVGIATEDEEEDEDEEGESSSSSEVNVSISNVTVNICREDNLDDAHINYENANTCSLSGNLWQSVGIFLDLDQDVLESGIYNSSMQQHSGVSQSLTGAVQCIGVPDTDVATAQVTVNYLDSSHPQCNPEEGPYYCDLNPTADICLTDECIADSSLPECNPGPIIFDIREQ